MKNIVTFICLLLSGNLFGQTINYSDWKEAEKKEIRLLPKYGNVAKTNDQIKADEEFIKTVMAKDDNRRKVSDHLVDLGFEYLYKQDFKTAMYRFNQAWLLDSTNSNAFWGFGAIYFMFEDFPSAMNQYEEGLHLNPNNTNIITDKATVFMYKYFYSKDEKEYAYAVKLYKQSYAIDPKNQNTLYKFSACYFAKHDCANAWKYYDECKILGGKPITQEYTDALTKGCIR